MLQAIAGYDARDVASIEVQIPSYALAMQRRTSSLRLGVPRATFYEAVDTQVLQSVERALDALRGLTDSVRDVELPQVPQGSVIRAEAFTYHAKIIEENRALYDPVTLERILRGQEYPMTDYVAAKYKLELARREIGSVFDSVDLLVTPTVPTLPIRIDDERAVSNDLDLGRNTLAFNAFGIPSISVPCGFSREGWPIGLQISGPPLGELDVLAAAYAYEQATEWHELRPPLS